MYRGADLDTQFMYMARKAGEALPGGTLAAAREQATSACVNILFAYRKYCATSTSSGQLILPEALKLLPLFTLALTKSGALRSDMTADARTVWLQRIRTFGPSALIPLIYPRLYNVLHAGQSDELLPPALSLSSEKLDPQVCCAELNRGPGKGVCSVCVLWVPLSEQDRRFCLRRAFSFWRTAWRPTCTWASR